jgi:putative peptidoglycan lipid II flippase
MRSALANTLRGLIFLSLPASLGLMILRRPVVALLFQRGIFDAQSTEMVAWALLWFAAGLVGHSIVEIISRAFYAMEDTRTPALVGAAAMTLNVLLSYGFAALFDYVGWMPHGGLALANSLATALESVALLWIASRRLDGLDLARIRRGLLATVGASIVLTAVLGGWLAATAGRSVWLIGLGGVALGAVVYWLAALLLGAPEARQLPKYLLSRKRS